MGYLEQQKKQIINLYKKNNSIRDVSKVLSCSPSGIKRILHKYKIPMRNKCESLNLCPHSFTPKEYEFLLGTMLGDAHIIRPASDNSESHFYIGHSIKQKGYIQFKHDLLKRFIGCKIYELIHTLKNGKKYITLNFISRKSKLFTDFRKSFYKNSKKVIPFDILEKNFTLFSLAVLYMDDGYNSKHSGCEINSQSFTVEENEKLRDLILNKFDIKSHLTKVKGGSGFKLYFNKKDKTKMFNLIRIHIIESMEYKIQETFRAKTNVS